MANVDTRQRLIEAAAQLVHSRGYNAVGVKEVCEAADANKGSFYHFFDSKEALMGAVLAEHRERLRAVREALPRNARGIEQLPMMYDAAASQIVAQYEESGHVQGCPVGSVGAEIATQSETIRQAVADALDEMTSAVEELVERAVEEGDLDRGTDAKALAQRLLAYCQGAILLAKSKNDPGMMQELRNGYLQLLGLDANNPKRQRSS
jgi:TetR/AcrR family transcriptional repressor of nem operon